MVEYLIIAYIGFKSYYISIDYQGLFKEFSLGRGGGEIFPTHETLLKAN